MASAAGGTSQQLKPGFAIILSFDKNPAICLLLSLPCSLSILSPSVIFFVPIHKPGDADFNGGGRAVLYAGNQVLDIGIGIGHITGLERQQILSGLFPQTILQDLNEMQQMHRLVVADVVEPVRRSAGAWIWAFAGPIWIRLCDRVEQADHTFDNIIDIGKISPVIAIIEYLDGLILKDTASKQEERHIGPAPGTVDRKKSEDGR